MSQKITKSEDNGDVRKVTVKPERLQSLFSNSRDLSLLNVKTNQRAQANKKSYAPNLNVARNRNADKSNEDNGRKEQKSDRGRNQRGRGGRNNVNNFSKKGNLIQSTGFLSEGIASAPLNRHRGEGYGGSSRDATADVLQKPKIVNRDLKPDKADLDADKKKLLDLLGDEDELNFDEVESKTSSDDFLPIKIKDPSKRSVGPNSKKLNSEIKIKVEPLDEDVVMGHSESPEISLVNGVTIKTEPGLELKSQAYHEMDTLFDAPPDEFVLFQMPDALPGRAPEASETPQASTSTNQQTPTLCSLEHLEEGLVGKLVRYKSGKTKLVLGETVYDVNLGLAADFQQNAVTINTNSTERSANLFSLGQINAKFNVTPDWIHLFQKMTS